MAHVSGGAPQLGLVRPHQSAWARNPRLKAVCYKPSAGKLLDNRAASADIRNAPAAFPTL